MDSHYQAYLLRLQRGKNQSHWRATLQNAQTGEHLRFASEREMLLYLLQALKIDPADTIEPFSESNVYPNA